MVITGLMNYLLTGETGLGLEQRFNQISGCYITSGVNARCCPKWKDLTPCLFTPFLPSQLHCSFLPSGPLQHTSNPSLSIFTSLKHTRKRICSFPDWVLFWVRSAQERDHLDLVSGNRQSKPLNDSALASTRGLTSRECCHRVAKMTRALGNCHST